MTDQIPEDHSYNLQHTNSSGYRHLLLPRNSITGVLEDARVMTRRLIRKWHVDLVLPVTVVAMIFVLPAIVMYRSQTSSREAGSTAVSPYALYKDIGTQLSIAFAIIASMVGWHKTFHQDKLSRASKFVEDMTKDDLAKGLATLSAVVVEEYHEKHRMRFDPALFNACHCIPIALKKSPDGVKELEEAQSRILSRLMVNKTEETAVMRALNYLEHMGQDVKWGVADTDYLKDHLYIFVITTYEFYRKFIEYRQYSKGCRIAFSNLVYMAQTWEKEGSVPQLPAICIRPLVLTRHEIENARTLSSERSRVTGSLGGDQPEHLPAIQGSGGDCLKHAPKK